MSDKRYTARVGVFVLAGLVLAAALMLNFSRGVGLFKPKYELQMRVRSAAGLKPRAAVFLLGVQVGNVKSVELDQTGKGVTVILEILEKYPLRKDAAFEIQQIGVLGDQFVIITPGSPDAPLLEPGAVVEGLEPFNLQEVARSTTDLLRRFDQLGATVGEAIERVNRQVLDAQTLSNLSKTIANFEQVSEKTSGLIDEASTIVTNSGPALTLAFTNLLSFSRKLDKLAMEIDETLNTNRVELNQSMKNLRDATASLKETMAEMESGKGVVGGLLKDEQLRAQLTLTVSNLSVLSSNFNARGLWSVLWKPKQPRETTPRTESIYPGKSGFK